MPLRAMTCPKCGAPLTRRSRWSVIDCAFCGARSALDGEVVARADYRRALHEAAAASGESATVDGVAYSLLGVIGRGESCDVWLAERRRPLPERVVVKIGRDASAAGGLAREREAVRALAASPAPGTPLLSSFIPEPVSYDPRASRGPAAVYGYRPGFIETLADLRAALPGGVDPRHGVWLWSRLLELLAWSHESGWCHGAVGPEHVVVNARDHGVRLVGWAAARASSAAAAAADVAASARCLDALCGGKPARRALPAALAEVVAAAQDAPPPAADALRAWRDAARREFGAPRFVPLVTPAWSS